MYLLLSTTALAVLSVFNVTLADEPKAGANPVVEMKTSMGTIKIELYQAKAPITVKNFLSYVEEKHYDGTVFHRVMDGFMIQGGGFDATDPIREKRTKSPIKNEASNGLKNDRGTIAMARTSDPDSASAQFFINVVDNAGLNRPEPDGHGYAVFGKVTEGMDVVDKIRKVKTGNATAISREPSGERRDTFKNVPVTKVVIESVRRVDAKK
jgi:peptidyl-prolyl cis-trans isomerase A (cyclophilin A)